MTNVGTNFRDILHTTKFERKMLVTQAEFNLARPDSCSTKWAAIKSTKYSVCVSSYSRERNNILNLYLIDW